MTGITKLINLKLPLVLASESPRRKKLLERLGFHFTVIPSDIDENVVKDCPPAEYVQKLALWKARVASDKIDHPAVIIGADTIVVLDGNVLNKPVDEDDAFYMLTCLSETTHIVYTGIALINTSNDAETTAVQTTEVTFRKLFKSEINAYIKSGSPMDKAGSYGIQDDFGAVFVSHINGCYYNIVGLPLELLYSTMVEFLKEK